MRPKNDEEYQDEEEVEEEHKIELALSAAPFRN